MTESFLLYKMSVKSVTLLFSILAPCNLLPPSPAPPAVIPEQEGHQAPLQSQAYVQAVTLCCSFQVKVSSLQWVLSTADKEWRNGHSPSPLQSESQTVWSRTSRPSSILCPADICVTCSPAYHLNGFFSKQMKNSQMFLSQLSVTDYCCSF